MTSPRVNRLLRAGGNISLTALVLALMLVTIAHAVDGLAGKILGGTALLLIALNVVRAYTITP